MNTLSVRLRYRPLRLAWCVAKGDKQAFRRAIRLSCTLWGGSFNPVVPVDDVNLADALVKLFRTDALVGLSHGTEVTQFIGRHKHLAWPMLQEGLFVDTGYGGKRPAILDISHPLARIYDGFYKNNPAPDSTLDMYEWNDADPLADVFLASYGAFPATEETGVDYAALARTSLMGMRNLIQMEGEVPPPHPYRETVLTVSRTDMMLHPTGSHHWDWPGFYVGDAGCFDDLVHFWNLRAADIPLQFFDIAHAERTATKANDWAARIRQAPARSFGARGLVLWHRPDQAIDAVQDRFGGNPDNPLITCRVSASTWNGGNVGVPLVYFSQSGALASVDGDGKTPAISFALGNKPFREDEDARGQHYVLSIDPGIGLFRDEQATLHLPFIPELNEYYGRHLHPMWKAVRSEPGAVGIVTAVRTEHQTLHALDVHGLIANIFGSVGIEAAPSKPGLIAATLIRQMGGLDDCRPFKIEGVRRLIEAHRPDQSFERATAMQTIQGQGDVRSLSDYQWLYIEPRGPGMSLTNGAVFSCLLEKGVFRAGLNFTCPSCQLEFWRSLDEARSRLECDYCGHAFNATPQLRDKGWAFRRSGLFGNDDHQQGAIPVLLTLQQLMHACREQAMFTTAMTLTSKGAAIRGCETDFVVMVESGSDRVLQIAIGECKTRQRITADDVAKLKAIAEAFPSERYAVYIVFARLTDFSAEEIELIKPLNEGRHRMRVIMLTERELEPLFPYERVADEFGIQSVAGSFEDLASVTARVYLTD